MTSRYQWSINGNSTWEKHTHNKSYACHWNETKRKETSALQMLRERLWRKKNLKYLSIDLTLKITGVALDCLKCKKNIITDWAITRTCYQSFYGIWCLDSRLWSRLQNNSVIFMINYANCILLLLYINIFDERKKEQNRQGKKEQTPQQITYRIGVDSSIQKKKCIHYILV